MKYWVFFLAIAANTFQAVNACGSTGSTEHKNIDEVCEIPNDNDCVPTDDVCHIPKGKNDHCYDKKRENLTKKCHKIISTKEWKALKTVADIKEAGEVIEKVREQIHEHAENVSKATKAATKLNEPKGGKQALQKLEEIVGRDLPVLELVYERRSPIHFDSNRDVSTLAVVAMFEAARWSPSWENAQPSKFAYVSKKINPKLWNTIVNSIIKIERGWASTAPAFMVATTRKDLLGKPNPFAKYDLGQAVAYMTVQAYDYNVFFHQVARVDTQAIADEFNVSDEFEVVLVIALGYIGDEPTRPMRMRKPLDEVFTVGRFKQ